MKIDVKRTKFLNHWINVFENHRIILGFSEIGLSLTELTNYLGARQFLMLKQIHSNRLHHAGLIKNHTQGDGIILSKKDTVAVIKTADCLPLFFWSNRLPLGGVIHVGWRGFLASIDVHLVGILREKLTDLKDVYFYMGPAIEMKCYEVRTDLVEKFKQERNDVNPFSKNVEGGILMDISGGVAASLISLGVKPENIQNSRLCTFCEKNRFPSHRRDGNTGQRIYNFLMLK